MLIFKDRVQTLEASQFRLQSTLDVIVREVSKIKTITRKHKSIEDRLERIEKQQAQQAEQLSNISSQLHSIEKLLQCLVESKPKKELK